MEEEGAEAEKLGQQNVILVRSKMEKMVQVAKGIIRFSEDTNH